MGPAIGIRNAILISLALWAIIFALTGCKTDTETRTLAQVAHVTDGDSLTLVDGRKVRLAWIDAPEIGQPGGAEARMTLEGLTLGKHAVLEEHGVDRYKRLLAVVTVDGGTDVNYLMVRSGNAWHYVEYAAKGQRKEDFDLYAWAEQEARRSGFGLWGEPAVAPWEWRKRKRLDLSCDKTPEPVRTPIKVVAV